MGALAEEKEVNLSSGLNGNLPPLNRCYVVCRVISFLVIFRI